MGVRKSSCCITVKKVTQKLRYSYSRDLNVNDDTTSLPVFQEAVGTGTDEIPQSDLDTQVDASYRSTVHKHKRTGV